MTIFLYTSLVEAIILGPRAYCPGQAEHVEGPHGVGLDRLDGVIHVVQWAGGAGQVVDVHFFRDT